MAPVSWLCHLAVLAALALALLAACEDTSTVYLPERSAAASHARCAASSTRNLTARFVTAFNEGDLKTLDRLVSPAPAFLWYSVSSSPGRRVGGEASDRGSLRDYLTSRHRAGERLRLTRFRFNGNSQGYAHFEFSVTRSANDLKPLLVEGKGASDCSLDPPSIAVWSIG